MFWSERIIRGLHLGDEVKVLFGGAECLEQLDASPRASTQRPAELEGRPGFTARVVTMFEDLDVVGLALDAEQQHHITLSRGQTVVLERPDDEGLWLYAATVRSKHGIRVELSWPHKSTRVERREFCRVRFQVQTRYSPVDNMEDLRTATTEDLSGGGICLLVAEDLYVGQKLVVDVPLNKEMLTMKGLVRNVHTDNLGRKVAGLEFVDMNPASQDKILNFVFTRRIKLRRERLSHNEPSAAPML